MAIQPRFREEVLRFPLLSAIIVTVELLCLVLGSDTRAQERAGEPVPVQVGTVSIRAVAGYSWVPGSIVSRSDARVTSLIAASVVWVAEVGQRVKAGDVIAVLNDTMARLRREDLVAQVERAKAQERAAATRLERYSQLDGTHVISASQLDDARAERDMAHDDVKRSEAQLLEAEYEIEQTRIRAPFPGVVTERFIQKGEYVQVGAPTVRLVDTADIEARATAALGFAATIRPGQAVTIRDHDTERLGWVRTIVPVGDDHSRQIELRISLKNAEWLVGSPIEISLPSATEHTAVTIPRDALVIRQSRSYVLRVTRDNAVEEIDVTTGAAVAGVLEIVRGALAPGDQLVVRGGERLSSGQIVRILNQEPLGMEWTSPPANGINVSDSMLPLTAHSYSATEANQTLMSARRDKPLHITCCPVKDRAIVRSPPPESAPIGTASQKQGRQRPWGRFLFHTRC